MTVTIKPLAERDFFAWYSLFSSYAGSLGIDSSDEETMRVWTALQGDDAHGVVAFDESGEAVGFAHFSVFTRLLQGDSGLVLEDVFVADGSRRQGVATALVEHVRTRAESEHRSTVRWLTRQQDDAVKALQERFASSTGEWAMYDLTVG